VFQAVQDGLISRNKLAVSLRNAPLTANTRQICARVALLHESGTYLKFTGGRGPVRMNLAGVIVFWQWGRTIH
jgi:hypothetical protein